MSILKLKDFGLECVKVTEIAEARWMPKLLQSLTFIFTGEIRSPSHGTYINEPTELSHLPFSNSINQISLSFHKSIIVAF
jgi:hypothetical protein